MLNFGLHLAYMQIERVFGLWLCKSYKEMTVWGREASECAVCFWCWCVISACPIGYLGRRAPAKVFRLGS